MPSRTGAWQCTTQPINYRCAFFMCVVYSWYLHPLSTVCTTIAPRVLHFSAVHFYFNWLILQYRVALRPPKDCSVRIKLMADRMAMENAVWLVIWPIKLPCPYCALPSHLLNVQIYNLGIRWQMTFPLFPCFQHPQAPSCLQPYMKVTHPLFILVDTMRKVNTPMTLIILLIVSHSFSFKGCLYKVGS